MISASRETPSPPHLVASGKRSQDYHLRMKEPMILGGSTSSDMMISIDTKLVETEDEGGSLSPLSL